MDTISVKEAATRWELAETRITKLCAEGKIEGAQKLKGAWRIPVMTQRPMDNRRILRNPKFRFIDLFAGIGGFHQAMRSLGGECVMAAEIDDACIDTYLRNFITLEGKVRKDVNDIDPCSINPFDVLCAGFPCQPFSKAGFQRGFEDKQRGGLFYKILDILDAHKETKVVVLENVRNLADKIENWEIIKSELEKRDFILTKDPLIFSPSDFKLPQIRERVYILGIKRHFCKKEIIKKGYIEKNDLDIRRYLGKCKIGDALKIIEKDVSDDYLLPEEKNQMIVAWDEFRKKTKIKTIGFPIWISCFGLGIDNDSDFKQLISYEDMPEWKKNYVNRNRYLYLDNRAFIDTWVKKYDMTNRIKLFQKFEWNCGEDVVDIRDAIIQIRQSGIRVKRPNYFPSLVAIVNTPIIWDKRKNAFRYISPREAANLQNFDKDFIFRGTDKEQYKQLGNSVNVKVLKIICKKLFELLNS